LGFVGWFTNWNKMKCAKTYKESKRNMRFQTFVLLLAMQNKLMKYLLLLILLSLQLRAVTASNL
jgi:hypothetical protein